MSDLVTFTVRHREGCGAVDADPEGCTCTPTVHVRVGAADDWSPIGSLRRGWTRADLANMVVHESRR